MMNLFELLGLSTLLPALATIFMIAALASRRSGSSPWRSLRKSAQAVPDAEQEQSMYDRIRAQAIGNPGGPIDYREFPVIPSSEDGLVYRPGARDMLMEKVDGDGWSLVSKALRATGSRSAANWRALEDAIRTIEPGAHYETFMRNLRLSSVTTATRDMFAEMAVRSSDYAAVKWGIVIASAGASLAELEALLPLARHSEFTFYVCSALYRESRRIPASLLLIEELIPMTEGWGLYHALTHTTQTSAVKNDPVLQRNCVVRGMERGDGARGHIAEMIVRELDLPALLEHTADDPELASAMLELLESLVWTPEPPGMLASFDNAERVIAGYVDWMETLPPGIEVVRGLRSLAIALAIESLEWESRESLFERTRALLLRHLDADVVAEAIRADRMRETALQIVVELGLNDLAPVVVEDFRKRPSALNIDVLGHIGEGEHLQLLFEALPDQQTRQNRLSVSRDAAISGELHNSSAMYAAVVRHMGKLGRPEALAGIKTAAGDFHPWVRAAAMYAMGTMQRWTLDTECKKLVRSCLGDSHDFVREAARQTATFHNLNLSINGLAGGNDVEMSLN